MFEKVIINFSGNTNKSISTGKSLCVPVSAINAKPTNTQL